MKKAKLRTLRDMILGSILTLAIVFATMQVSARVTRTATVTTDNIKVYIDGEAVTLKDLQGKEVEPILVFDTLYAPVSPLARAFGKESTYDGNTKSVYINTPKPPELANAVKLSDLTHFTRTGTHFYHVEESRDNTDTYRKDCFMIGGDFFTYANGTVDYLLGKQYSHMTGTIFLHFDSRDTTREHYIKIYGDGKLLYESKKITGGIQPFTFRVDLNGVDVMKITVEGNATGTAGFSEATLYRN